MRPRTFSHSKIVKIDSARFVRAVHGGGDFVRDGLPQLAFVGRSNVGKSSLLNKLLGRKALARISRRPGRTQSVNYFLINERFYFVDLPGYGYARASQEARKQWASLVDGYLRQAGEVTRVIVLVDGKVGATPLDEEAVDYLESLELEMSIVATKIDQVPRGKRPKALAAVREKLRLQEELDPIGLSSKTGEGMKQLWQSLAIHLNPS